MRMAIYDMDGTIVCSRHRYRTVQTDKGEKIDLQFWIDNAHKAMLDSLLPLASQYRSDLADPKCYVIIATARFMQEPDFRFVREVLGQPDYMIYRKDINDPTSGAVIKVKGLKRFFNLKQFSPSNAVFYEDNAAYLKQVCDTFGIRGVYIPSMQGH